MLEQSVVAEELNYADAVWQSSEFQVKNLPEQLVDTLMREKRKERDRV